MPNPDGSPTEDELRVSLGNLSSHGAPPAATNSTLPANPYAGTQTGIGVHPADQWTHQQQAIRDLGTTYAPSADSRAYGTTTGLGSGGLRDRDTQMNERSSLKPWMSTGEAAADTRNNFAYGGSVDGAKKFNTQLGVQAHDLAGGFGRVQGVADRLGGMAGLAGGNAIQLGTGAQQYQELAQDDQRHAQAANPYAFVDAQAMQNNAADRAGQTNAMGQLNQFANQGEGPSAAQAQLNLATDANMQNSLALARSGRGMGQNAAALRQAIGQNAVTGQQAANQSAMLRAQESQAYQTQRLNALSGLGNLAGQARQGDVQAGSYLSGTAQAGQNAANQQALGYGQLGLGYGQQALGAGQLGLGAGQLGLGAGQLGLGAQQGLASSALGFSSLQNDVNKTNLSGGSNYEQNQQNYYLQRQLQAQGNRGTDYTPYIAAGAAGLATAFGGPGAGAAVYGGTTAVGEAVRDS